MGLATKKKKTSVKKKAPKKNTLKGKKEAKHPGEMGAIVKDIESALFSVKFYPVAVNEEKKDWAVGKLIEIYKKGDENVRQLLMYMIHETLSTTSDLKFVKNYEYFRARTPNKESTQIRVNVYRAMFNYNTSLEGYVEFIKLLGQMNGGDDAAKILTYHYSQLCTQENEASHVLRNAILDSLGDSESGYALNALLDYARYTNERVLHRILASLAQWDEKIEELKVSAEQKKKLRSRLQEVMTRELVGRQYG